LLKPSSPMRLSKAPTPGVWTSMPRKSVSRRAAAICAVACPMPKPISTISGASRPNRPTASSGWAA